MKNVLKNIKKSNNVSLALFAIAGLILNEILNLSVDSTAIKMLVDTILAAL